MAGDNENADSTVAAVIVVLLWLCVGRTEACQQMTAFFNFRSFSLDVSTLFTLISVHSCLSAECQGQLKNWRELAISSHALCCECWNWFSFEGGNGWPKVLCWTAECWWQCSHLACTHVYRQIPQSPQSHRSAYLNLGHNTMFNSMGWWIGHPCSLLVPWGVSTDGSVLDGLSREGRRWTVRPHQLFRVTEVFEYCSKFFRGAPVQVPSKPSVVFTCPY